MRIIIVGGGIGGLALALALRKAGLDFKLLERAPTFEPIGAGIQLSPNATRVLSRLGVWEGLAAEVVRPARHRFIDWQSGENLLVTPLGDSVAAAFGAPYAHAHRADLLDHLLQALQPYPEIEFGVEIVAAGNDENEAWVQSADGRIHRGDVMIAADGVKSVIRETLFAPQPPRFSGCVAWRGLTPADAVTDLGFQHDSHIWMGPERSVVIYYVSGGRLLNWIGITPGDGDLSESWTTQATVEAALGEFEGWHPSVTELIARSAPPFKWALYDREPLPAWVQGRIALIGDAAHAMLPYHAQGAAQSIEDAWVLARCLVLSNSAPEAIEHYQSLRIPRTTRVQEASAAAERLFHLSDPDEVERRNQRFARTQASMGEGFPPGQEWLFAYDAEAAATGADAEWRALHWR